LIGLALLGAGNAHAAVPLTRCGATAGLECGTVVVPLDRTGATPGSIGLHVEVLPTAGQARGVMFLVAGGPGQGSAGAFDLGKRGNAQQFQTIFPGYTLVAFDNRGTGASGLINCPVLQRVVPKSVDEEAALARDCADLIGSRRQFYATRDHAEDVESVRTGLGLGKIALFGVSYGTKLALAYARAHPGAVSRLVLDSVLPLDSPDPYERDVLQALPGTLGALCANGLCRRATADFPGDVVALANQLEAKPIRGKIVVPGGRIQTKRMNGEDLLGLVIDSDLSPGLEAELPTAVRAARTGYTRPLLRLFDLDTRTSALSARDLSFGLNVATTCADGRFPWAPDTPVSTRQPLLDAAISGMAAGSFGPFGNWAARLGSASFCKLWPSPAGNAPLVGGPLPNVPVLAISGGLDLRTPTANAQAVLREFPQGRLLVVPGIGHSALTADLTECSQVAVRNWILLDDPLRSTCPRSPAIVATVGRLPSTKPRRGAGPTLAAVLTTVREAQAAWLQALFSSGSVKPAGLYGGRIAANSLGFTLARYSTVRGVLLSGRLGVAGTGLPVGARGTVRVSGPAAVAGTLRLRGHAVTGALGGVRVSGRI
jgi:pimeloyl-ACP methyl ester carboxylesterase